jgi:hypothetical protein
MHAVGERRDYTRRCITPAGGGAQCCGQYVTARATYTRSLAKTSNTLRALMLILTRPTRTHGTQARHNCLKCSQWNMLPRRCGSKSQPPAPSCCNLQTKLSNTAQTTSKPNSCEHYSPHKACCCCGSCCAASWQPRLAIHFLNNVWHTAHQHGSSPICCFNNRNTQTAPQAPTWCTTFIP